MNDAYHHTWIPESLRWGYERQRWGDLYCQNVHVLFKDQKLEFRVFRRTKDSHSDFLKSVLREFKLHTKIKLRKRYMHLTGVPTDHQLTQTFRLHIGLYSYDRRKFYDTSSPLFITDNGDPVCPEKDIYPDSWTNSTKSFRCSGPIRMRLAMCVGAVDRFIELLQVYKNNGNVINAIDQNNNTWLHRLCFGLSPCGYGYKECKESWLKMAKAFISAVDISWMLEHKNVCGRTPMFLARKYAKEMVELLP